MFPDHETEIVVRDIEIIIECKRTERASERKNHNQVLNTYSATLQDNLNKKSISEEIFNKYNTCEEYFLGKGLESISAKLKLSVGEFDINRFNNLKKILDPVLREHSGYLTNLFKSYNKIYDELEYVTMNNNN